MSMRPYVVFEMVLILVLLLSWPCSPIHYIYHITSIEMSMKTKNITSYLPDRASSGGRYLDWILNVLLTTLL